MALTADELRLARKVYTEVESCEAYPKFSRMWPIPVIYFFIESDRMIRDWQAGHTVHAIFLATVAIFSPIAIGVHWYNWRRLRGRYAENIRLLEELRKKADGRFPLEVEIPEEHPLLEFWSRRLEKRAILWRLDAFLSRKPVA